MWPFQDPFLPNFAFFSLGPPVANERDKFEVSSFNRSRDMEGVPKFQKVGHVTPCRPIWPNFALFRLGRPVANLHAKFEVSSFNRCRDMEKVPKF